MEAKMLVNRRALVLGVMMSLVAGATAISSAQTTKSQASADEQKIWNLEHDYWRYVEDNNLSAYLALWHKDFLGWPAQTAAPVGKDHITDWITPQTAKGLALKSIEFKPAKI